MGQLQCLKVSNFLQEVLIARPCVPAEVATAEDSEPRAAWAGVRDALAIWAPRVASGEPGPHMHAVAEKNQVVP